VGLEAGSQLKSQGKWLGVGGPSVGLYVHLLEFNPQERGLVEVQLRYAPQSTPYTPDIGLAFNALAQVSQFLTKNEKVKDFWL
jgi:hypothetical protein